MPRRLRRFIARRPPLSLLLCVALSALWARSRHHADIVLLRSPAGHAQWAAADNGGLLLVHSTRVFEGYSTANGGARAGGFFTASTEEFAPLRDLFLNSTPLRNSFLGFKAATSDNTLQQSAVTYRAIVIPFWLPVMIVAAFALRSCTRAWTRWRRPRRGLCVGCGYDLRASTVRCPECGLAMPASASAT